MGDLPEGGSATESKPAYSLSTSPAELNPFEIGAGNWAIAERAAREIIRNVQPNSVSEERRKRIVDYIQRLIRTCLGAEVFAFGSVPLKTYLPDGDIDLTAFGGAYAEDTFANDVRAILEKEEKNASSEFVVKDARLVGAEVKLVKCIVEGIVIDLSFNQLGGLSTLCFLEQVNRLIGRDHLFKRSIILIKAWCYYESRVLGAHRGLISTYALETMVLYIFQLFHSKLDGPLAVLFKFLDYFTKFDWDTYCISLNGPVRISSLPAIIVDMPGDCDRELLLHSDFLSSCMNRFSVPYRGDNNNSRGFQPKHLNIFDPLKGINNLGRSVSRGNFYRICSAFAYGARKLSRIICQPVDSIPNELYLFFSDTMERHGGGYMPRIGALDLSIRYVHPSSDSPRQIKQTSNLNKSGGREGVGFLYHAPPNLYFPPRDHHRINVYPQKSEEHRASALVKSKYSNLHVESNEGPSNRPLNLSDLSGDFEGNLRCLNYGKQCYEQGLIVMHSSSLPPSSGPLFQNSGPWDSVQPLPYFDPNKFSYQHHPNGLHPGPALFSMQPVLLPSVTYGWEEPPKPRGMGMYFPNTNQLPQDYRPSAALKGRALNHLSQDYRPILTNQQNVIFPKTNMPESGGHEISQYSSHNNFLIRPEGGRDLVHNAPGNSVSKRIWGQKPISSPSPRTLSESSYSKGAGKDFSGFIVPSQRGR